MTDEELDLLASAYVDGEATPDEVALVERDPELLARVEAFRAVGIDGSVTPPAGLADRHLAAAMAEFDALAAGAEATDASATGTVEAEATAPVVDLRAAAARREPAARANGARPARRRPPRTMPSWLPAAAGFVIIGGGLVWAVGQTGGGSDDDTDAGSDATETAALAVDDESSEESEDADTALDDAGQGDGVAASSAMAEEEAAEDEEAMEEEAADEAARNGAAAPEGDDGDSDDSADDAEADFADPLPLLFFDEVPDLADVEDLPELELDLEQSRCGPEIVTEALGDPLGFITVEVDGELAELYVFRDGDGTEIRRLVDQTCLPLAP